MEEPAKETIIVVHGTWASPEAGKSQWYSPTDPSQTEGFIAELDAALEERGSAARCWAHCREGDSKFFHWSGENSWISRARAAEELGDYVGRLAKKGWVCHLVAHSHGGNVVLQALPKLTAVQTHLKVPSRIVTLGTPFVDVVTPALEKNRRREETALFLCVMFIGFALLPTAMRVYDRQFSRDTFLFIGALVLLSWITKGRWQEQWAGSVNYRYTAFETIFWLTVGLLTHITLLSWPNAWKITAGLGVVICMVIVRAMTITRIRTGLRRGESQVSSPDAQGQIHPKLLVIGSRMDEAWQLLHHLRNSDNPLAVKLSLPRYLISAFRMDFEQRVAMDRLFFSSYPQAYKFGLLLLYLGVAQEIYSSIRQSDIDILFAELRIYGVSALWPRVFSVLSAVLLAWSLVLLIGGRQLLVALLLPVRWCGWVLSSFTSAFSAIGTYVVRRASWPVFLRLALGLEGYGLKLPMIEQCPSKLGSKFVRYESIPAEAETRALEKRSAWIESHVVKVSQTFSKLTVSPADISALLRTIEKDQTLVHATYYTDKLCIARIADWLAEVDTSGTAQESSTIEASR